MVNNKPLRKNTLRIKTFLVLLLVCSFTILPLHSYHLAHANQHADENGGFEYNVFYFSPTLQSILVNINGSDFSHTNSGEHDTADDVLQDKSFKKVDPSKNITKTEQSGTIPPDLDQSSTLELVQTIPVDTRSAKEFLPPCQFSERSPPIS